MVNCDNIGSILFSDIQMLRNTVEHVSAEIKTKFRISHGLRMSLNQPISSEIICGALNRKRNVAVFRIYLHRVKIH